MRRLIIPALILQIAITTLIPATSADISTTNPHIKTLKDWPPEAELTCTPCHGDPPTNDPDAISSNCMSECHSRESTEIATSQHSSLKCTYCHPILHIGDKNQENCNTQCHNTKENLHDHQGNDNFASIWVLDRPMAADQKVRFREEFYSYTDAELVNKLEMASSEIGKIYIAYLDLEGVSAGSNATRYLTCINCHFITEEPEEIGLLKAVGPDTFKIGVPKVEVEFIEHHVEPRAEEEFVTELTPTINQILPAVIAIAAITIIVISTSRRRKAKS